MKQAILAAAIAAIAAIAALGALAFTHQAQAAVCGRGVYRAGCVGPNGAAVVRRPPYAAYPRPYYAPHSYYAPRPRGACGAGPYRAGCVGPNGAAVVRRPPY